MVGEFNKYKARYESTWNSLVTLMYKIRDNAWFVTCNFDDSDTSKDGMCESPERVDI